MGFPPKSSILIGFSIFFTIHFGVLLFLEAPISTLKLTAKAPEILWLEADNSFLGFGIFSGANCLIWGGYAPKTYNDLPGIKLEATQEWLMYEQSMEFS